jgi:hypothetical protein
MDDARDQTLTTNEVAEASSELRDRLAWVRDYL